MLPVDPRIAMRFMDRDMVLEDGLRALGVGRQASVDLLCAEMCRRGSNAPVVRLYWSYSFPNVLRMNCSSILLFIKKPSQNRAIASTPMGLPRASKVPTRASNIPE